MEVIRTIARLESAIDAAVMQLSTSDDDETVAKTSKQLAEMCRRAQYKFGACRTNALSNLRDEGWSLADMSQEFGISRARLSAMINREERRDLRKEDQKKQRRRS
jgi:AraC-like DNA-binding protein